MSKGRAGDAKYFGGGSKKGEQHELRLELQSPNREKKKDAVKKVIANMTVGKSMDMLFTDVINCIQTDNIELKKLVYLYLINYAKSQPEQTLLVVNTFVKDTADPNPLIRALAVRTMGCIRVEKITEYLCEPLRKALRDEDPYVRKTAAVCVAKLYDVAPQLVEDQGFLQVLRDLICDPNPTVVANSVAALSDITDSGGVDVMHISSSVLQKLLAALNECTEWGQVYILDSLSAYTPSSEKEAEGIIERVCPRLQHANSAVVLSAVKVILIYLEFLEGTEAVRTYSRKLAPPMVTLLNSEPEMQYVALRNINLIVQKRPKILEHEIKVFFCKYNDPIYVKMEKLETIIRLVSDRNIDQVLLELKEYAQEVDVEFVRKAVRAIGRCAIKLEKAAERCINVLLELIENHKVEYVLQEAVIVIKDIFRKYPNRYESVIAVLCDNLDVLDEPEAKASIIWIIGEYAERIDNADEQLWAFLETFEDESSEVQLQLLTATVKLFLKQPDDTQDMVKKVLQMATQDSDNPDLRDRGFVYWRLLSTSPEAAKAVVLGDKPTIADDTSQMEPQLLNRLIGQIATLASVYHKPPEAFVLKTTARDSPYPGGDEEGDEYDDESGDEGGEGGFDDDEGEGEGMTSSSTQGGGEVDLLDMGMGDLSVSQGGGGAPPQGGLLGDPLGGFGSSLGGGVAGPPQGGVPKVLVCPAEQGQGVALQAAVYVSNDAPGCGLVLDLSVSNSGCAAPVTGLAMQFNRNPLGIVPAQPTLSFASPLEVGQSSIHTMPLGLDPSMLVPIPPGQALAPPPGLCIQAAMKNAATGGVSYFSVPLTPGGLVTRGGAPLSQEAFIGVWKASAQEMHRGVEGLPPLTIPSVTAKLAASGVSFVADRAAEGGVTVAYYSFRLAGLQMLLELSFPAAVGGSISSVQLCLKTEQAAYAQVALHVVEGILRQ